MPSGVPKLPRRPKGNPRRKRGSFKDYGFFVSIEGEIALQRRMARVRESVIDLRPGFKEVGKRLRQHARAQFDSSGAEGGKPWARLTPTTQRLRNHYRRARGNSWGRYYSRLSPASNRPLIASGKLRRSFVEKGGKHVERIGKKEMEWGSKHPLAHLVVKGSGSRGKAPPLKARPVIAFRDATQRDRLTIEPIRLQIRKATRG